MRRAASGDPAVTSPAPRSTWRELADSDPYTLPTQLPEWLDAVCEAGRSLDASQLYEWADGYRVVVPLVRRKYVPAAIATRGALPVGWDIGGMLCENGHISERRAEVVLDRLRKQSLRATYFRPHPLRDDVWTAVVPPTARRNPRLVQEIDLRGGYDRVWKNFHKKRRNQVRRGRAAGLSVECDTTGRLLPDFDRLFRSSVRRWARQSENAAWRTRRRVNRKYSARRFEVILRHLRTARIWLVSHEGRPAAGMITVSHGAYNLAFGNAMDFDVAAPVNAQSYLFEQVIENACSEGYEFFYMGDTYPGTTVTRFRSSFGTSDYDSAGYWLPGGAPCGGRRGVVQ